MLGSDDELMGSDDELMGSDEDFLDSEENLQTTCARKKIRHDKVWFISSTGPTVKGAGQARAVQYTYRLGKENGTVRQMKYSVPFVIGHYKSVCPVHTIVAENALGQVYIHTRYIRRGWYDRYPRSVSDHVMIGLI